MRRNEICTPLNRPDFSPNLSGKRGKAFRFTNAWEQRKFSKLYKRSSEKNDGSIGIERNITVATMQFKSDIRLSSDDYLKTYFTFKVGDIAFEGHQSKEFRYGRFVENDIGDGIVSHIFTVFRPIQRFNLHFWKYAINSENLMQKILSRSTKASTMMHDLVPEDFLNETFLVPSIDEQKAVGKFLHQIDNLLTLHQRQQNGGYLWLENSAKQVCFAIITASGYRSTKKALSDQLR